MVTDPRHTPMAERGRHQVCQSINRARHSSIHCHSKAIGQHLLSMVGSLQQARGCTVRADHNPAGDMLGRRLMARREVLDLLLAMPRELQKHQAISLPANTWLHGISSSTSLQLPAKPGLCMAGLQYSPPSTAFQQQAILPLRQIATPALQQVDSPTSDSDS